MLPSLRFPRLRSRPSSCSPRRRTLRPRRPRPTAPLVPAGAPLTFSAYGQGALVVRISRSPAVVDGGGAIAEDGGRLDGTCADARAAGALDVPSLTAPPRLITVRIVDQTVVLH